MILDWKLSDQIAVLPSSYDELGIRMGIQRRYRRRRDGMFILTGLENHDGKWWLHVSCSYGMKKRLPNWDDLREVKNIFIGRFKKAIQILPDEKNYVNIHPFCLHLFYCDNDELPEFSHEGTL